ncbi:MOSC domain-containing protein [Streptomyces cacaoi]|uniref:MOSC domain-containing protein n=1 Tax=Streptomyces cacaoi TaxID=1898 RepID=UPI000A3A931C|nr:MOSC domain-containing protein [Streptomyces cacaoi]NNG88023.1 MOSC domain-containing protein [Streptomyces cacaoi]
MRLLTVNIGRPVPSEHTDAPGGRTGIDKRPVEGPVSVFPPGAPGVGGSGLLGDAVCDLRNHGGEHQAVYAFAREQLDHWEGELGRTLASGVFGENLTTSGVDVDGALIGERWRIGEPGTGPLLEVSAGRIPCRTFAGWLREQGWVKRFMAHAMPGAYLRVIEPGEVRAGDAVQIAHRPEHEVTVSFAFRALTREPALLPRVLAAGDALHPLTRDRALRRTA